MKMLKGKYRIILSSDSNHKMVDSLIKKFVYDELFISDDLGSYKASADGRFFGQVISRLGVKPSEILHIGDSISDIGGAHRAKIKSCWINRDKSVWKYDIKPDYIIKSLLDIDKLLSC
jgi:HAD superfamily hydrolase (TIGR01549 family)